MIDFTKLNWIFLAIFSAITFGLGDFIVVLSEQRKMDVITLYNVYTVIVGILSAIYLFVIKKNGVKQVVNFSSIEWLIVGAFSFLYFFAYVAHFIAIQKAPNPGYANSLIMFHVVILTVLAYYFLGKPLNSMTVVGMAITFVGAYIVTQYSGV
jgi:drug/metabolite transporter (DMT)-like permease